MRRFILPLALALGAAAPSGEAGWHLVSGSFEPGRQPDGNSVFLDAPEGLILVDTGRHPEHQAKLLAYARARGRPIAAIVNTHWHLDHTGGNSQIRAAYPEAPVYGSAAVEGALTGFFPQSRKSAEAYLASGQAAPAQETEIRGDLAAMEDVASLRPTRPVTRSATVRLAGRDLRLNLAPFAATEGDVWVYDRRSRLLVAGDLVVGPVPFFDTGCPEGWRKALGEIAATPFATLVPGHGEPMSRPQFLRWRRAFDNLLDCAASSQAKQACVAGWKRDAAAFIPAADRRIDGMVGYYLDTRLRAAPAEREKYCRPLR
ncbi:MAG TPA: MBL fold metallo-hydrolase [Allosphingosinicella sp.]|jgi:glyoxylase-like metal-dependent hydrolase (beta-lactamase superfamily II)|nr:MBL fold metallo-hydrolase [Allosphingosinicella sp.]